MCEAVPQEPRISVSVEMKVNLGNYESVGGSCVLSGLNAGATDSEIRELLDTADMTFRFIREKLEAKLEGVRQEKRQAVAMKRP
jgi:hypothetical protein